MGVCWLARYALQGASDVGRDPVGPRACLLRLVRGLHARLRPSLRRLPMIFDYSLAGLVTAGLMIYLVYALLQPERF